MEGFDDGLGSVNFESARIPLGATGASPTPTSGANQGVTPAPTGATPIPGSTPKPGDAITDDLKRTPKVDAKDPNAAPEKPAPYDQDPKWKKARAAEKALQDIQDKFGAKSPEELIERLSHSAEMRKLLGERDVQKLLKDSEDMESIRSQKSQEAEKKRREGETPEQTIARLERKMSQMDLDSRRATESQKEIERHQKLLDTYEDEVIGLIKGIEEPLPTGAKGVLGMIMGINNPAGAVDIEDLGAVRATAKDLVGKFSSFVKSVQQSAVDDYVNGKSSLVASKMQQSTPAATPAPTPDVRGPATSAAPRSANADQAFSLAKKEFADILAQGLGVAP